MMQRQTRSTWFCLLLVVAGLAVSGYLLSRSFLLMADSHPEAIDICTAVFGTGCDETLQDTAFWVLGIPLAGWGIVYYVVLAVLLIMALALREAFAPQAMLAALLIALSGLTNSVVLAAGAAVGPTPICPLCLLLNLVNLSLVPALMWANGRSLSELVADASAGLSYVLGGKVEHSTEAAWKVVGFVTVALVTVVTYQWIYVEIVIRQAAALAVEELPKDVLSDFLAQPAHDVATSAADPRLGTAEAPAVIVVFSDFQCPHCVRLSETLVRLRERYGKDLAIVFKHFPLSTTCNGRLKRDVHPRACQLAWAAQAAHGQGKFWAFHDAALAAEDRQLDDLGIDKIATAAGLKVEQFSADRMADVVRAKVAADIALGAELGVAGTPTAYLNGRRVASLGYDSFETLLEHELDPRRQ